MRKIDCGTLYEMAFGTRLPPDQWQIALATDPWPRVLVAPTGSGKTAAVTLGWAAHRLQMPDQTPRRLVWCLPMRTLVEQTAKVVKKWFDRLAAFDEENRLPRPEDVHILMGGVENRRWLETPEHPAVIVGTQDMLLSRALMRGYASSRTMWPVEFALLHEDAQWVFDEVQLMGAGRATSAQIEAFRRSAADQARRQGHLEGNPSRSLWMSATLDQSWLATVDHPAPAPESVVKVDPVDHPEGRLARLAHATKRLTRSPVAPVSSKISDLANYIKELAQEIVEAHRPGQMTLAIVNRVKRAQLLYEAVDKDLSEYGSVAPTLALIHSRFRPAERAREMVKVTTTTETKNPDGLIVIATQAVEAGLDISAGVVFTEIAPWASMVQRFGRANRYAEVSDGSDVQWIDLLAKAKASKQREPLASPYTVSELEVAKTRLLKLTDVAPVHLPPADDIERPRHVIRRKDLDDLFDTDSDLTGLDVDVSPYVRDSDDTDIRVFWRDLQATDYHPVRPHRKEVCAVAITTAREWISKLKKGKKRVSLFQRDPQWRQQSGHTPTVPSGWTPFTDQPRPGLTLLADQTAGGYRATVGFTGNPKDKPEPVIDPTVLIGSNVISRGVKSMASDETDGHDEDSLSQINVVVKLADHLRHVSAEAESLCLALGLSNVAREAIVQAARWHDLGKAHDVFQETMRRGLDGHVVPNGTLLAKTIRDVRHSRAYFRHELASALAFLTNANWSRNADLVSYLILAHHGKVRMNLRALPRERAPAGDRSGKRFARGVWEDDELPPFDLEGGDHWKGGPLVLSIMELGWDDVSHESWTERTRELLTTLGPFRLAWLETILRLADWRASAKERGGNQE